ncbi:hypothetical protein ACG9XY_12435 [Acinetobacter seifertii]|uniref:hypothetical protein n=1 Tax=Acinetobacter seifertii TaxID=1530123 RepID=UPI00293FBC19|nr:hypothetical protein [Acinetobacter seifertii]MDV4263328.1 hypothetical protein [Acinetobacter seifertii]
MNTNKIEETKEKSKFPSMLIFTVVYLAMVILYCFLDVKGMRTLRPNEWGDFLAGFFAPLVFIWLIYGYHQQGKELSLQLEEVKNSVNQQTKMVNFQQQEIDAKYFAAKPFFKIENPKFEITKEGDSTYDLQSNEPPEEPEEVTKLFFEIKNLGEVAKHISVIDSNTSQQLDTEYEIKKDSAKRIFFYIEDIYNKELASNNEVEFYLTIIYFNTYGKEYKDYVIVKIFDFDINSMHADVKVRKVDREK